jgi:hypothetical protein
LNHVVDCLRRRAASKFKQLPVSGRNWAHRVTFPGIEFQMQAIVRMTPMVFTAVVIAGNKTCYYRKDSGGVKEWVCESITSGRSCVVSKIQDLPQRGGG